jgi:AcrR family transcriptional regulator
MAKRRPYAARVPIEERREQLLDAALEVISDRGYGRVSIDAIAKRAKVTRPVVYGAFGDLDGLLFALLERQATRALAKLLSALEPPEGVDDPSEALRATIGRLVDVVKDDPEAWRPILIPFDGTPEPVRARIAKDRERVRGRVEELLLAGIPAEDRAGVDSEVLSHAAIGIAEHFGRILIEDPDRFSSERLAATAEATLTAVMPQRAAPGGLPGAARS